MDTVLRMLAGEKPELPDADLTALISAIRALIPIIEQAMWAPAPDIDSTLLETYQAAYRLMEQLIARQGIDLRHRFVGEGIGPEPINGFGRESHQRALLK